MDRACVICGQKLPPLSKMTRAAVPAEEAAQNGWAGEPSRKDEVIVDMCMQCQIDRAEAAKGEDNDSICLEVPKNN